MAAEFLSTQIAQRHFIAFQVIEKKSKVVAIKNFRRVFGPAAMELADFDFWWDSFKNHGCYKSLSYEPRLLTELPVIPLSMIIGETTWLDQREKMAAEFLSTPTAQRHFIAFQVIEKKPKVAAIKNFRRVFGPADMELADFDFWWDSFKKQKCYKSISYEPRLLTELPVIPLSMIVGETTWLDQLALRETSRIFRQLVDQKRPKFEEVVIDAKRSVTTMTIDGVSKVFNAEDVPVIIEPEKIYEASAIDETSAMKELMMRLENKDATDIHCSSDPVTIRVEKAVANAMSILNSLGGD